MSDRWTWDRGSGLRDDGLRLCLRFPDRTVGETDLMWEVWHPHWTAPSVIPWVSGTPVEMMDALDAHWPPLMHWSPRT